MPDALSGYASAAAFSFGSAALSLASSVENVPVAPSVAPAGRLSSPVRARRHDARVQRDHRFREQLRTARLRLLAIDHEPDPGEHDDHDADDDAGDLSAGAFRGTRAPLSMRVRELVFFQMVTFFALHGCLLIPPRFGDGVPGAT